MRIHTAIKEYVYCNNEFSHQPAVYDRRDGCENIKQEILSGKEMQCNCYAYFFL